METGKKMKEATPKVSVIVPVYNPGEGIKQCLASLCHQSLQDIEMIFIDDCGDDGAMEYVRDAAAEDARIRILVNDSNSGAGYSRNRGIEEARGEYLSFVDPDDYVAENFLELLYTRAVPDKPDIVKGERLHVDSSGAISPDQGGLPLNGRIRKGLAKGEPIFNLFTYNHWTAIFRRECIIQSGAKYGLSRNSQDTTFLLRAGYYAKSIALEDDAIYFYVARKQSRMNDCSAFRLQQEIMAFNDQVQFVLEHYDNSKDEKEYICERIMYLMRVHSWAIQSPDTVESARYFLSSLQKLVSDLPFVDDLVAMSTIVMALVKYEANLSTWPYRVQGQEQPLESTIDVIRRWAAFIKEHPECAEDTRYGYHWRDVYIRALSDLRLSPQKTSLKRRRAYYQEIRKQSADVPDKSMLLKDKYIALFLNTGVNGYQIRRVLKKIYLHVFYRNLR